jgi:hypothetical protein
MVRFRPIKAPAFASFARILLAEHAPPAPPARPPFPLRSKMPLFVLLLMRSLTGNFFDGRGHVCVLHSASLVKGLGHRS